MYWFKRKLNQIKRVIDYLPIIWNGHDFDYLYATALFKHQLKRTADYLDSDNAYSVSGKVNAQKIRTAIKLMDKVYDEDYAMEYMDKMEEKFGKLKIHFEKVPDMDGYELKSVHADDITKDYYDDATVEEKRKMFLESMEKQRRAHKLLWDYIEWNIQHWWD